MEGIYFLIKKMKNQTNKTCNFIIYVGQSLNIRQRVGSHLAEKAFDEAHYLDLNFLMKEYELLLNKGFIKKLKKLNNYEKYVLNHAEAYFIHKYNPILNKKNENNLLLDIKYKDVFNENIYFLYPSNQLTIEIKNNFVIKTLDQLNIMIKGIDVCEKEKINCLLKLNWED